VVVWTPEAWRLMSVILPENAPGAMPKTRAWMGSRASVRDSGVSGSSRRG
jgi:hypothetical protein